MAHQAGAYPGFRTMKRIGVFLLPPEWDASPSQGYSQYLIRRYPFIHLNGKGQYESKVYCPRTQHSDSGLHSNLAGTARSRIQTIINSNRGTTPPPSPPLYKLYVRAEYAGYDSPFQYVEINQSSLFINLLKKSIKKK